MDQRHRFVPDVRSAGGVPQVDVLIDQLAQAEMLSEGGRQDQPGVGHRVLVVEGHREPVETVRRSHRKGASVARGVWVVSQRQYPCNRGTFRGPQPVTRLSRTVAIGGSGLRSAG
jgi:hypothetical protein